MKSLKVRNISMDSDPRYSQQREKINIAVRLRIIFKKRQLISVLTL
jgi:hypothetical protein